MKKMMSLFAMFILVTGAWCRAEMPWNRALASEAALKSYLMEQSSRAFIGIWGGDDVVPIPGANQYVWVYNPDGLKLADSVRAQKLGIGVVIGSDNILIKSCYFYRVSEEGQYCLTFSGQAEGKVIQMGDSKILIWKDLEMKLPERVVIDLPKEYSWAYTYLRYTNEEGNTQYEYLGDGTSFEFPTAFSGITDGRVIIRGYTTDGYQLGQVVDLESGEFLPIDEFVENFHSITMEGISYHKNGVAEVIPSENSVGENPLFQLRMSEDRSFAVSVRTSEGEYPKGFFWRTVGGEGAWGEWQYEQVTYPEDGVIREKFWLPAGEYHLQFDWENFHSEEWKDYQFYDNGGGGKG